MGFFDWLVGNDSDEQPTSLSSVVDTVQYAQQLEQKKAKQAAEVKPEQTATTGEVDQTFANVKPTDTSGAGGKTFAAIKDLDPTKIGKGDFSTSPKMLDASKQVQQFADMYKEVQAQVYDPKTSRLAQAEDKMFVLADKFEHREGRGGLREFLFGVESSEEYQDLKAAKELYGLAITADAQKSGAADRFFAQANVKQSHEFEKIKIAQTDEQLRLAQMGTDIQKTQLLMAQSEAMKKQSIEYALGEQIALMDKIPKAQAKALASQMLSDPSTNNASIMGYLTGGQQNQSTPYTASLQLVTTAPPGSSLATLAIANSAKIKTAFDSALKGMGKEYRNKFKTLDETAQAAEIDKWYTGVVGNTSNDFGDLYDKGFINFRPSDEVVAKLEQKGYTIPDELKTVLQDDRFRATDFKKTVVNQVRTMRSMLNNGKMNANTAKEVIFAYAEVLKESAADDTRNLIQHPKSIITVREDDQVFELDLFNPVSIAQFLKVIGD